MNKWMPLLLFLSIAVYSCKRTERKKSISGLEYIVIKETAGPKAQPGNFVTVDLVYRNEKDSILFDTRSEGKPLRFRLHPPAFQGSFEEALTLMSEGDSMRFFISADSLWKYVFSHDTTISLNRIPAKGTTFAFDVAMKRIQTDREAEMEMAMEESRLERAERKRLQEFILEKEIHAKPLSEGYYVIIHVAGKGEKIKPGNMVTLHYTGRFLNGKIFDNSLERKTPFQFTVGQGEVISGWDLAMQQLHAGDKASIILPSSLAYGPEGIRFGISNRYVIPPYASLIFEVQILDTQTPH